MKIRFTFNRNGLFFAAVYFVRAAVGIFALAPFLMNYLLADFIP